MKPRRAKPKSTSLALPVRRLAHGEGLSLPQYQSAGAAGADLLAAIGKDEPLMLEPGERALVPTGLALQIPPGYEAQVRPRSGLAWKHGITVLNSPGTIDSDYRGELRVLLINFGQRTVMIERGERIAQLVLAPVMRASLSEADRLNGSRRGAAGFGSTGRASAAAGGKPAAKSQVPRAPRKSRKTTRKLTAKTATRPAGQKAVRTAATAAKKPLRSSKTSPVRAMAKSTQKTASKRSSGSKSATARAKSSRTRSVRAKAKTGR